ncbi:MAG: signal transduction histidine kinase [Flavobacteriales bacterium]
MKKHLLIILLLCCGAICLGQQKADSLYIVLESTTDNQQRFELLEQLLGELRPGESLIAKKEVLLEEAYSLANALNTPNKIAQIASKEGAFLFRYARNPSGASRLYDSIIPLLENSVSEQTLADLHYSRVESNFALNKFTSVIEDGGIAAAYYNKVKDSSAYADAQLYIGKGYANLNQLAEAVIALEKGLTQAENREGRSEMMIRFEIATLYSRNDLFDKATKEQKKLIQIFKDQNEYISVAGIFYNRTNNLGKQKDFAGLKIALDSASYFLDKAETPTERQQQSKMGLELLVDNVYASYYLDTNQIDKAKEAMKRAEAKQGTALFDLYKNALLLTKAKFAQTNNKPDDAISYLEAFIATSPPGNEDMGAIEAYEKLHVLFAKKGAYKKAYQTKVQLQKIQDRLISSKKNTAFIYYQTLYETERKEAEIFKQQTNITLLENDNDKKRKLLWFGGASLLAIFGFVLLMRNRKHIKASKELQEQYTHNLLNAQEVEKERISKDLHDGLGQSLLLIKNKVVLSNDEGSQKAVNDAIEEVRSISRALHPFQLRELGLTRAIENVVSQIDESSDLFINQEVENIDGLIEEDNEVHIYRIVQESFNNIIKHAQAKAVKLELKKSSSKILLTIKDNGVGFDFSERYNDFNSLGLKTLKERTKLLNGIMEVNSEKGSGTTFTFSFPFA